MMNTVKRCFKRGMLSSVSESVRYIGERKIMVILEE